MKNLALFFTVVFALIGCSASGPKYNQYESTVSPVNLSDARIYFFRPSRFMAGGVDAVVSLNGQKVGECGNKGYFFTDVKPGHVSIKTETKMAPGEHIMEMDAEPGKNYYVEVEVNEDYVKSGALLGLVGQSVYVANNKNSCGWIFKQTPKEDAIAKMQDLSFSKD